MGKKSRVISQTFIKHSLAGCRFSQTSFSQNMVDAGLKAPLSLQHTFKSTQQSLENIWKSSPNEWADGFIVLKED